MTNNELMEKVHDALEETTIYLEQQFNERFNEQQKQIDGLLELIEILEESRIRT